MCDKGWAGQGINNIAGWSNCGIENIISNCEYHYHAGVSTIECYNCKKDYAVGSSKTECKSFTHDPNCRVLNYYNACHYCWHSYYWSRDKCQLASQVLKNGLIYLVLGWIFLLYI